MANNAAKFENESPHSSRREQSRRRLRLAVDADLDAGSHAIEVHNISTNGILLKTRERLAEGQPISLQLAEAGSVRATVVWCSDAYCGCRFDRPISRAAISAAVLCGSHLVVDDASRDRGQIAAMSTRIATARKTLRLGQQQLADIAQVSKTTVWKWENGRAMPRPQALARLAHALKVDEAFLLAGHARQQPIDAGETDHPPAPPLQTVIGDCKTRIAKAAGIAIEKIRIELEY